MAEETDSPKSPEDHKLTTQKSKEEDTVDEHEDIKEKTSEEDEPTIVLPGEDEPTIVPPEEDEPTIVPPEEDEPTIVHPEDNSLYDVAVLGSQFQTVTVPEPTETKEEVDLVPAVVEAREVEIEPEVPAENPLGSDHHDDDNDDANSVVSLSSGGASDHNDDTEPNLQRNNKSNDKYIDETDEDANELDDVEDDYDEDADERDEDDIDEVMDDDEEMDEEDEEESMSCKNEDESIHDNDDDTDGSSNDTDGDTSDHVRDCYRKVDNDKAKRYMELLTNSGIFNRNKQENANFKNVKFKDLIVNPHSKFHKVARGGETVEIQNLADVTEMEVDEKEEVEIENDDEEEEKVEKIKKNESQVDISVSKNIKSNGTTEMTTENIKDDNENANENSKKVNDNNSSNMNGRKDNNYSKSINVESKASLNYKDYMKKNEPVDIRILNCSDNDKRNDKRFDSQKNCVTNSHDEEMFKSGHEEFIEMLEKQLEESNLMVTSLKLKLRNKMNEYNSLMKNYDLSMKENKEMQAQIEFLNLRINDLTEKDKCKSEENDELKIEIEYLRETIDDFSDQCQPKPTVDAVIQTEDIVFIESNTANVKETKSNSQPLNTPGKGENNDDSNFKKPKSTSKPPASSSRTVLTTNRILEVLQKMTSEKTDTNDEDQCKNSRKRKASEMFDSNEHESNRPFKIPFNSNDDDQNKDDDGIKCILWHENNKERSCLIQADVSDDLNTSGSKKGTKKCGPYLLGNIEVTLAESNGTLNIFSKEVNSPEKQFDQHVGAVEDVPIPSPSNCCSNLYAKPLKLHDRHAHNYGSARKCKLMLNDNPKQFRNMLNCSSSTLMHHQKKNYCNSMPGVHHIVGDDNDEDDDYDYDEVNDNTFYSPGKQSCCLHNHQQKTPDYMYKRNLRDTIPKRKDFDYFCKMKSPVNREYSPSSSTTHHKLKHHFCAHNHPDDENESRSRINSNLCMHQNDFSANEQIKQHGPTNKRRSSGVADRNTSHIDCHGQKDDNDTYYSCSNAKINLSSSKISKNPVYSHSDGERSARAVDIQEKFEFIRAEISKINTQSDARRELINRELYADDNEHIN